MNAKNYDEINENIRLSEDLAYWVGVVQTDGYLKQFVNKTRNNGRIQYYVKLGVVKSIPMLEKFRKISMSIFGCRGSMWKYEKTNYIEYKFGASKLLPLFKKLDIDFSDPPKPPRWCLKNSSFFGAYLAGVIDGDGDVRFGRPKYLQCKVRIWSGHPQKELQNSIEKVLKCSVNILRIEKKHSEIEGRAIFGGSWRIEFYVSKKNYNFIEKYLIRHLALEYKRNKIKYFISNKIKGRDRESNPDLRIHSPIY